MADQNQNGLRPLRVEEDLLVRALLRHVTGGKQLLHQLDRAQISEMADGGMGSLQFAGHEHRFLGGHLIGAEYLDRDGVRVSIALNVDTNGLLYELDIWRVDFAPIQGYPMLTILSSRSEI